MTTLKLINIFNWLLIANFSLFAVGFPYSKQIAKVCFWVGLFLWGVINICSYFEKMKAINKSKIFNNPVNIFVGCFLVCAILSTIFSLNFYHSQRVLFERYIPYILLFMIGYLSVNIKKGLYVLTSVFLLGSVFLGVGGVYDHFHLQAPRLFTVFGTHINMSNYLLIAIPLSLVIIFWGKYKFLKALSSINLVILLPVLIWNGSRSCWLVILLIILLIGLFRNIKLLIPILVFIVMLFIFIPGGSKNRLNANFDTVTIGGRDRLYAAAINMVKEFPAFGAGVGMYKELLYRGSFIPTEGYLGRKTHLHAHNVYLEIAAEMGIIGLISFVGIFFAFFWKIFKSRKMLKGLPADEAVIILGAASVVFVNLIHAFSATTFIVGMQDALMFWLILGIGSGALNKLANPILDI